MCASWFGLPECPVRKELYSYGVGLWTCTWYLRKWSIRDYIRGMTVFHFFFKLLLLQVNAKPGDKLQRLLPEWHAHSRRWRILRSSFSRAQMSLVVLQLACNEGVFAARVIMLFVGLIFSRNLGLWNWQRVGANKKIIPGDRTTSLKWRRRGEGEGNSACFVGYSLSSLPRRRFEGSSYFFPPKNACSTQNNIPFPLLHSHGKRPINGF